MTTNTSRKIMENKHIGASIAITAAADLVWFDSIGGERQAVRIGTAQSGGAFTVVESLAGPGAASPMHTHREDEVFFVLEGVGTFSIDGVLHQAPAGTTLMVPGGVPHAWKNKTQAPLRVLVTFTPGGIETLFQQVAGKSMEDIASLAATYGTHVVGPPIA